MVVEANPFRVKPGEKVGLKSRPTRIEPLHTSKAHYRKMLGEQIEQLSDYQERLYAENRTAVLLIFQGMDAAGKDSAIEHVMSGVNPQGCQVFSFKQPSAEELDHDFLWRTARCLPERGRIGIFNRSYYEEVLVVRVHPDFLAAQRLPETPGKRFWKNRFRSILEHEAHLDRNGTRILKFYLHLSPEEQRKRLLARVLEPEKNWKVNLGDVQERAHWADYMDAYEDCLAATSTENSPWYVVPADDKETARLIISEAILDLMKEIDPKYPELDEKRRGEIEQARKALQQ